jgi:RNA polymerase sigma factor (sigma-70 family)
MIGLASIHRFVERLPSEIRLARQSRSGNVQAFVRLCDLHTRDVYRYVYFLVPNNRTAEGLTVQVFFKAWERLNQYRAFEMPFIVWLIGIAQGLISDYLRMHTHAPSDNEVSVVTRGGEFREEFQTIRNAINALPMDQRRILVLKFIAGMPQDDMIRLMRRDRQTLYALQADALCTLTGQLGMRDAATLTPVIRRILEASLVEISGGASTLDLSLLPRFKKFPSLEPLLKTALLLQHGHDVKPNPAFNAYVHNALTQSLRVRQRSPIISPVAVRRAAVSFVMLAVALMAVGTAQAQSALPGEALYNWKRTSEKVLYAFSPDATETDMFLAERRLEEWIAVMNDPALSPEARLEYEEALSRLVSALNGQNAGRVKTALLEQHTALEEAGLASEELDEYLDLDASSQDEVSAPDVPIVVATPPLPGPAGASSGNANIGECPHDCKVNKPGVGNHGVGNNGAAGNNAGGNNGAAGNNPGGNNGGNTGGNNNGGAGGNNNGNAGGNNNGGGNGNAGGDNGGGNDDNGEDHSGGNDKGGGKDH